MGKVLTLPQFKPYNQQQLSFLPLDLGEMIPAQHLVRVVNTVVDGMDITAIINGYKGGGTTAWHPAMMLKIILYAYSVKIYTGRKIARALRSDIHFMWLSGNSQPDFRTINDFRSSRLKETIENIFEQMLMFLVDGQYIKIENYFCDGSSFAANANRHKMVWKKNAERYEGSATEKCRRLFKEIDTLNTAEDKQYGSNDLEETGNQAKPITQKEMNEKLKALQQTIAATTSKKSVQRKANSLKNKLEKAAADIDKYQLQKATAGERSGYSKTDTDATAMYMKNEEILPAYNVMASTENQFITACTLHQNSNDGTCFKPHLAHIETMKAMPDAIVADSIFGTEENYEMLQKKDIENYLKFPTYHGEQTRKHRQNKFHKDNFGYHADADYYTCPNEKKLIFTGTINKKYKHSGFISSLKQYECESCAGCPFYEQCNKSNTGANRTIQVNEKLEVYKQKARENLNSTIGEQLRKRRSIEVESCFGDIKHNMNFRRFHLRGLQKVKIEWSVVAIAHNLRKISLHKAKKAA